MTAGLDGRREGRQRQNGKVLLGHAFVLAVPHRAPAATDPPHFVFGAACVPAAGHPRHAPFARAEEGDLSAEAILVDVPAWLESIDAAGHPHAGDFGKRTAADAAVV